MNTTPGDQPASKRQLRRASKAQRRRKNLQPNGRPKLSILTLCSELLFTAGIGVFGFLVWQPWYTGNVVTGEQSSLAAGVSAEWQNNQASAQTVTDGEIPVPKVSGDISVFGVMYVPAFGENWANQIAVGKEMNPIMDDGDLGIAKYPDSSLPGADGNFAVAAHRSGGRTTPFHDTDMLRVGDPIYIETADGWYTYRFRSVEYVLPTEVDVLNPFPRLEGQPGKDKILTLTTCNPKYWGLDERMIAYSVFESFTPRDQGPPAKLAEVNSHVAQVAAGINGSASETGATAAAAKSATAQKQSGAKS